MTPECRDRNPLYCSACGSCEHEGHDKTCPNPESFSVPAPACEAPPANEHELLVGGIVRAALELAILRGDLRMDSGDAFDEMSESEREDVISDTWNAMNGEGTCNDKPVKELTAIYRALAASVPPPRS